MKKLSLKKAIAGVVMVSSIGGGSIVIDNSRVTDAEIRKSIEKATIEGRIPLINLSKVSLNRIATGYLDVALDNGVNIRQKNLKTNDVYDLIREAKKKKGTKIAPRTTKTLQVK